MFWHNQQCSHSVKETINRCFHERIFKSIEIFHIKGKTTSVKDIISYAKQKYNNLNKRQSFIPKWQSKMDNPEKLAIQATPDEDKQNTLCVGHHYAQTNTI